MLVTLTHRDRYGYPAQASACARCGLVFLNPRMTAAAYGRFYDGVYRPLVSAFHGRLIDARTIQAEQREYAADRAEFVRPFLARRRPATMLDIGGSTGVVAGHFAQEFGLDRDADRSGAARGARRRAPSVSRRSPGWSRSTTSAAAASISCMICQTVDHLLDVAGTLRRVRELLTERRLPVHRHRGLPGGVSAELVGGGRDQDRSSVLPDAGHDDRVPAAGGLRMLRVDYAADHLHVSYLCRPTQPAPDALPDPASVVDLFREIRFVQNAPRPR